MSSAASSSSQGFSTRAIHAGQEADETTGATIVPIYQTSTYTQLEIGKHRGFDYSRTNNPTRQALEQQLAALEEASHGIAFSSGMATTSAIMNLLSSGDHVIVGEDLYGGSYRLFTKVLPRYGVEFTFVDARDLAAIDAAQTPKTKLIWIETPTNPLLRLFDIKAIAGRKRPGQILVVDNTFASPYFQTPLNLNADIVMHSTTKYIGGHSDVVGGIACTNNPELAATIKFHQNAVGGVPSPFDAWLTMRGAKTLKLRMKAHAENAQAIAEYLEKRDDVEAVHYPGLTTHPQHALAKQQMHGFGGMLSFTMRGDFDRVKRFVTKTHLFSLAESLGGVESLICHPASMTHGSIPAAERESRGISERLLRLSVGIEETDDLIQDIKQALDQS
jgi:cystathionine beta-lyase/cystathionine gamma-synthase